MAEQITINVTDQIPAINQATIDLAGETGNTYAKSQLDEKLKDAKSGIKNAAKQTNAPTPYDAVTYPNGLFETYVVRTPLTMPNSWGSAVTQAEIDSNYVYFDVKNGVVTKILSLKPTVYGKIEKWTAKTYLIGSQVIFDKEIWENNANTTALEIPKTSPKWVAAIKTGNPDVTKVLETFLKPVFTNFTETIYTYLDGIKGSLQTSGVIIRDGSDGDNKIITVDLTDVKKVYIKARPFNAGDVVAYSMFLGIKANGDKVNLIPPRQGAPYLEFNIEVSDFVEGKLCYNYSNGSELETVVKTYASTTGGAPITDIIHKQIDFSLHSFIPESFEDPYKAETTMVNKVFEGGSLINNGVYRLFTVLNPNGLIKSLKISGEKINSNNPLNGYIIGIKPDNSYVILESAKGARFDNNAIYTKDYSPYTTIYVQMYLPASGNPQVWSTTQENPLEFDSVKKYIDKNSSGGGNINLASMGFSTLKTEAENTAIFNEAFVQAKAKRINIIIPSGTFLCSNVQVKAGVGFKGSDRNTILKTATANPIFVYSATEAQSFIESNQLSSENEFCNQGVTIGAFILSGSGIGTIGLVLNNIAYSRFERIYMTGFTDACVDAKGMLLCDWIDCQFTKSPIGIRATISTNNLFWANLVNFRDCRFRFLTKTAVDWSKGAGVFLTGCDLSAIGTAGDLTTGAFKLKDMSTEDEGNGIKGFDLSLINCWSEQLRGGYYIDLTNCKGKTVLQSSSILRSLNVGDMAKGILNRGSNVTLMNMQFSGLNIETSANGITKVLNVPTITHSESTGGIYKIIDL